ncbi:MAG: SRPBCC domain-containing protein [Kofleriaceae bacterium]
MSKHTATTKITIHASKDQVWKALTTPELIKQYMMGADVHTDWNVGSPLTYTGEYKGKKFEEKGTIKKIEPGKTLAATHFSSMSGKPDVPENYALVTWELEPKGDDTVLSVSQDNIDSDKGVEQSKQNWTGVLSTLKKVVEKA